MMMMVQMIAGVTADAGAAGMLITGAGIGACSLTITGGAGLGAAAGFVMVVKLMMLCGLTVGSTAVMAKK